MNFDASFNTLAIFNANPLIVCDHRASSVCEATLTTYYIKTCLDVLAIWLFHHTRARCLGRRVPDRMMLAVSIVWFWLPNSDSPLFMYIVIFVIYTWFNYIFRVEAALTNAAKHARSLYTYIHAHRFCIKKNKLNRNRVFRQMRSARGNSSRYIQ